MNVKYYLRLKTNILFSFLRNYNSFYIFDNSLFVKSELCAAIHRNDYNYVEYIIKLNNIETNEDIIVPIRNLKMYNLLKRYNKIKGRYIYSFIKANINKEEWINEYIKDYKNDILLDKALALAAYCNNIYVVPILIENGADINRKTPSNPLYNAVYNSDLEMVKLLIENGAMVDIWIKKASNYGNTLNGVSYKKRKKIKEIIEEEFKVQSLFTYSLRCVKKNKIVIKDVPDEIKEYL